MSWGRARGGLRERRPWECPPRQKTAHFCRERNRNRIFVRVWRPRPGLRRTEEQRSPKPPLVRARVACEVEGGWRKGLAQGVVPALALWDVPLGSCTKSQAGAKCDRYKRATGSRQGREIQGINRNAGFPQHLHVIKVIGGLPLLPSGHPWTARQGSGESFPPAPADPADDASLGLSRRLALGGLRHPDTPRHANLWALDTWALGFGERRCRPKAAFRPLLSHASSPRIQSVSDSRGESQCNKRGSR